MNVFLLLALSSSLATQTPEQGVIRGAVLRADTSEPIPGVIVNAGRASGAYTAEINGRLYQIQPGISTGTATTDGNGQFVLRNLQPGNYTITPQHDMYRPAIRGGIVTRPVFPDPIRLQPMVIRMTLRGERKWILSH